MNDAKKAAWSFQTKPNKNKNKKVETETIWGLYIELS